MIFQAKREQNQKQFDVLSQVTTVGEKYIYTGKQIRISYHIYDLKNMFTNPSTDMFSANQCWILNLNQCLSGRIVMYLTFQTIKRFQWVQSTSYSEDVITIQFNSSSGKDFLCCLWGTDGHLSNSSTVEELSARWKRWSSGTEFSGPEWSGIGSWSLHLCQNTSLLHISLNHLLQCNFLLRGQPGCSSCPHSFWWPLSCWIIPSA